MQVHVHIWQNAKSEGGGKAVMRSNMLQRIRRHSGAAKRSVYRALWPNLAGSSAP